MCGICGIVGENNPEALNAMVAAMHHRGPDDKGTIFTHNLSMGMARLSIIDVSLCGHQPMVNDDKTILIVYNGETYNFSELRRELEAGGCHFHSASDTEVVLHLYERYGDNCVLRMQGMFAFAVWDIRDKENPRLLIARDPLGIKPVLYTEQKGRFVFASEMKSLLAGGLVAPRIDAESLRLLLTYGSVPQPATIIEGVRMLLPGHRLIIEKGSSRLEKYWTLRPDTKISGLQDTSYDELRLRLRSSLEHCVRQQMVSDVPIGAFLSGGIDSSILVALMARASPFPVKTFSVGYGSGEYGTDEADDAEKISRFIGTDHTRVVVTGPEVRERIGHFAAALDQPSLDGLNSYFVSLAASRQVTVAISGTGGDELFAGYPWFIRMAHAETFTGRHPLASRLLEAGGYFFQNPAFDTIAEGPFGRTVDSARGLGGDLSRFMRFFIVFSSRDISCLLTPQVKDLCRNSRTSRKVLPSFAGGPEYSLVQKITGFTLGTYTQNQLLRDIDAVSMAHSLEVRVPFLDHSIVELAFLLPDETKLGKTDRNSPRDQSYRATGAKRILIDSCRDLLPEGIDLQEKRGFGMPFENWLKGPLKDVVEDALSPDSIRKRGFFNPVAVRKILDRFYRGKSGWQQVWLLLITELWCREVLDNIPPHHPVLRSES
jgi:asparagine synthase (glutamine-hydrolysing)